MTLTEKIITIMIAALATVATRALPFALFRADKPTPKYLEYLGKALPPAVFAMLVVYCLKGISLAAFPHALPEIISISVVVLIHLLFRKMLLSILGGTVIYLVIVNLII